MAERGVKSLQIREDFPSVDVCGRERESSFRAKNCPLYHEAKSTTQIQRKMCSAIVLKTLDKMFSNC